MTLQFVNQIAMLHRGLVVDPAATHVKRMRQAIWLYLYLLLAVNPSTGKRILSPSHIAGEMGLKEETVRSWLGHLRRQGYVAIERQGDLVAVTVIKWPKRQPPAASENVNRKSPLTPEALAKALGCDPSDPFLKEVVMGEDLARIQEVLAQVTRVPEERIKKSRLALFRYLLKKTNPS